MLVFHPNAALRLMGKEISTSVIEGTGLISFTFVFEGLREREREKEVVRVKARREAIVKAGMSEVLSNYRRCDKSDLMGC